MVTRSRALALSGVACVAVALVLSGCGPTRPSGKSGITLRGNLLSIYLSAPANWRTDPIARQLIQAEQLAFDEHSSEVTDFHLTEHVIALSKVSDNARVAIQDKTAIAYLGELGPGTSEQSVGITNALDLLQVSPTDTAYELAGTSPVVSGSPKKYFEDYSTYGHTFARVVPTSEQEAAYLVQQMLKQKLRSVYVADDGSDYGKTIAEFVKVYAQHSAISVSDSESSAAAIFYGTQSPGEGATFFNSSSTGSAKLFGSSALDATAFLSALSPSAASRLYISTPGIPAAKLNASAHAFQAAFAKQYGSAPSGQAIFGYAAMSAVLTAIHEAGEDALDRATVTKDFLAFHNEPSVLGDFSMSSAGNTSFDQFTLNRVSGNALVAVPSAS